MATQQVEKSVDSDSVEALNERLAEVFRTNDAGDVFTADVFFDLNMPVWRFQMQGVDAFESWRRELAPEGSGVNILRTVPTVSGFVTEYEEFEEQEGELHDLSQDVSVRSEGGTDRRGRRLLHRGVGRGTSGASRHRGPHDPSVNTSGTSLVTE